MIKKLFLVWLIFFVSLIPLALAEQWNQLNFTICNNNGVCDSGEDKCTCASDCGECSGNVPNTLCQEYSCLTGLCRAQIKYYCCGNHICESGENFSNCDADCAPTELTIELLSPADENVFLRGENITFKAKVKADGVIAKQANVRVKTFAGDIPMYDDGNHSDEKANDGVYAVSFLVSELTSKNNYASEISAEKLGVSKTHNFVVKVNPELSLDFSIDKNNFVLGEIIYFQGTIFKKGNPVSTVITITALNKNQAVFESKTKSDANGFFSLDQRTSLIYPEGNWHFIVSGKDVFENQGILEKTAVVSREAGTIFMDVLFPSGYEKLYSRGSEMRILFDVLFDEIPVEDAEVNALFPDGKEVALKMVSKGKYSLSYSLPFDFPLGQQKILVNAKKTIGSVKYGGSTEMEITVDEAKINAVLLEPKKQTAALGEELNFRLRLNYENGEALSKPKISVKINNKEISSNEKETGVFYFSYVVSNDDLSEARQLLLEVQAIDTFGNKVYFDRLFEVTGELTLEYYFRENPLLFLSVIFAFIFIIIVIIVIKKRLNTLNSLTKRKKELERLKGDLQEKYFNLGAMSSEQYYSLLSKYSSELRDIDSAIDAFKKASEEKGIEVEEEEVFGEKKVSFDDSEMGSMFKISGEKNSFEEEEIPGLFSVKKKAVGEESSEKETPEEEIKPKKRKEKKKESKDDLWGN
jgi:hypothetical protein